MHGDDRLRLQQIAGVCGFARPHGVVVADGQHGNLGRIEVANDGHVTEHIGIAGVVDLHSVGKLDHVAAGLAAVNDLVAVGNSAGVVGVHHGDLDVADGLGAAFVHLRDLLDAFLSQPVAQLGNCHHHRVVLLGDFDGVADVVEVTVGAQHDIHFLDVLLLRRTRGIAHDPGVDEDGLAAGVSMRKVAWPNQVSLIPFRFIARPSVSWQLTLALEPSNP